MPEYAFRATDRMGNQVDGTVSAPNEALAANQIGQMGYALMSVQAVSGPTPLNPSAAPGLMAGTFASSLNPPAQPQTSADPTLGMAPYTTEPSRPRPIDLTQPVTEMPPAAASLMTAVGTENADPNATAEMKPAGPMEPWQRGGPVEQASAPRMTMSSTGAVLGRTQPMNIPAMVASATQGSGAIPSVYNPQSRAEIPQGRELIPYGAHAKERERPLPQRIMEMIVYPIFSGVVLKDLAPFYRQFATLVGAGLPIYQALVALEGNTNNAKLKEVARAGQRQVQAGGKFSDVLAAWPWIFKPVQVELIRAAEQGGMLEQVLKQIADYVEHELEIKRIISRETLYPKIVLFVALMILGRTGLMFGPMALVRLVLGGMGHDTYTGTEYLLDTIGFGLLCLFIFLFPFALFRLFLFNVKGVRESYDTFKMAVPGFGKLAKMFAIARFGRTMSAMYRAGFNMSYAMDVAGDAAGNAVLRRAIDSAIPKTERGMPASDALRETGFFPPMVLDMFRTGETAGRLDEMLDKMSDFFEAEGKLKTHTAALIFGTAVLLLVAILVAVQVIHFYMSYGQGVSSAGSGE